MRCAGKVWPLISVRQIGIFILMVSLLQCQKSSTPPPQPPPPPPPAPASISFNSLKVNGSYSGYNYQGVNTSPVIAFSFSGPVNKSSVNSAVTFQQNNGTAIPFNAAFQNGDSTIVIQPVSPLSALTKYSVSVSTSLKSAAGGSLLSGVSVNLFTSIDSSDKFPVISDEALLTLVQKQTFKYFWDFGHPTSGLARERNSSGDVVTTGGSGFGIMAMLIGVERGFITRAEGLQRLQLIVDFLKNIFELFDE